MSAGPEFPGDPGAADRMPRDPDPRLRDQTVLYAEDGWSWAWILAAPIFCAAAGLFGDRWSLGFVAETDAAARRLFTSAQQQFTNLVRGTRGLLRPPIDDIETYWAPHEKAQASRMLARSLVGSPQTVRAGLAELIRETGADEIMVAAAIHDQGARRTSYAILAEARDALEAAPAALVA